MNDVVVLDVELPSGIKARAVVSLDAIAVLVNGRMCVAHPRQMTPDQANHTAEVIRRCNG